LTLVSARESCLKFLYDAVRHATLEIEAFFGAARWKRCDACFARTANELDVIESKYMCTCMICTVVREALDELRYQYNLKNQISTLSEKRGSRTQPKTDESSSVKATTNKVTFLYNNLGNRCGRAKDLTCRKNKDRFYNEQWECTIPNRGSSAK
jgi:hypothetical protein